ncbi:MAG: hypothetical protein ACON4Z_12115 [Planctomycetota bacterium]
MSDPAAPPPLPPLPPRREPAPKRSFWRTPLGVLSILVCAGAGLVFVAFASFGVALELGYFPGTAAVSGADLPERVVTLLRDEGVIEADEEVLYFYGGGLFDYMEDGNLCTDQRVISYWTDGGELYVEAAAYADIVDVEVDPSDGWLVDATIDVEVRDGDVITLYVAGEGGGDEAFEAALRRAWRRGR